MARLCHRCVTGSVLQILLQGRTTGMDGKKFDSLIKRFCSTQMTRKSALRGLVAGAAAAITGSALIADDAAAKKRRGRVSAAQEVKACPAGARQTRHLGEACGS